MKCSQGNHIRVLYANGHYYIGTTEKDEDGCEMPNCQLSYDRWDNRESAELALKTKRFQMRDFVPENVFCHGGKGCIAIVQVLNPKSKRYTKINKVVGVIVEHKKSKGPYKNIPIVKKKEGIRK